MNGTVGATVSLARPHKAVGPTQLRRLRAAAQGDLVALGRLARARCHRAAGQPLRLGQAAPGPGGRPDPPAVIRRQLAVDLVADVRQLEQRIAAVEARIKAAVAQSNTTLVQPFGVGPVLAARFWVRSATSTISACRSN